MMVIKVDPGKLASKANKLEKDVSAYEDACEELVRLIESNPIGLDQKTMNALKGSCEKLGKKWSDLKEYMMRIASIMEEVASRYLEIDRSSEKLPTISER